MSDKELPNTLYHYTINDALISIMQSKKIRLSNLQLSNDSTEGRYFFNDVIKYLKSQQISELKIKRFQYLVDYLLRNNPHLGFCLSTESDMLSQWRAYADNGNGVCIGFNRKKFELLVSQSQKKIGEVSLEQVIYANLENDQELKDIVSKALADSRLHDDIAVKDMSVDELLKGLTEIPLNNYLEQEEKAEAFFFSVYILSYLVKNPFFHEEKEWRLLRVITNNPEKKQSLDLNYRVSGNRIIPFQNFPADPIPTDLISEIVLGPKNETPIEIVSSLLSNSGFKNVKITRSEGSYR